MPNSCHLQKKIVGHRKEVKQDLKKRMPTHTELSALATELRNRIPESLDKLKGYCSSHMTLHQVQINFTFNCFTFCHWVFCLQKLWLKRTTALKQGTTASAVSPHICFEWAQVQRHYELHHGGVLRCHGGKGQGGDFCECPKVCWYCDYFCLR